jgi:RNA polymerase sigma-70 factor (sigma-E family)
VKVRSVARTPGFDDFARAHWQGLVRTSVLLGCTQNDAEDLAQACLVKVLVAWPKVQRAEDPVGYVYKTLINTWRTAARKDERSRMTASRLTHEPAREAANLDVTISVRGAIGRLNATSREVVVLRYYLDLSERETAHLLGVPIGTVKSRLARAISRLSADPALTIAVEEN